MILFNKPAFFQKKHLNESCTLVLSKLFLKIYPLHKGRKNKLSKFYSLYFKGYCPMKKTRQLTVYRYLNSNQCTVSEEYRSASSPPGPTAFLPCMTSSCSPGESLLQEALLWALFPCLPSVFRTSPVHAG